MCFDQTSDGLDPVGRVVLFFQLAQAQARAVVHRHFDRGSGIVFDGDVFEERHEADFLQRLFVVFHVFVGLGRAFVIVEGYAGRNHVEHDRALVGDGGFQHGVQLLLVAGERAADKRRAQSDRHGASVDRREIVDHARFQLRAQIGGGGELAFGQAVNAVVFDDVDDRQIAPHQVDELADADGGGVAVAADAERDQVAIRQHGAGRDRGHASMHGIEAVRAAHEVRRTLGRAADAAGLDHALGRHAHFVHGVDDALGNCVVAAAGAQRGLAAAIVEDGQAQCGWSSVRACWSVVVAIYLPSMVMSSSVTDRASSGRP